MSEASLPLFDLNLTDEQALMRETVRRFAATEMRPRLRKADEAAELESSFYARAAELGFTMVQVPEALGGMGASRSPLSNMLLVEDLAHGDMAMAIGATCSLSAVNVLLDQATEAQQAQWLPALCEAPHPPVTLAIAEPRPRFDPRKLETRVTPIKGGFELNGDKTLVALAGEATQLLVLAEQPGLGPSLFVVPRGEAGVIVERERFMGLRPLELSRVRFSGVKLKEAARVGGPERPFELQRLLDLGAIGSCALAVGCGQAVLEYVRDYVNERVAFGEPISHRQSVAFMVADIAIELEGMRLMTYRAASRAEQGLAFTREAYLARMQCTELGMKIGTDGVQLLGGHGYTREHPVELWYRNLRALSALETAVVV